MSGVSFQSLPILIDGYDPEGHLVFIDGQLAALLARLDADALDPDVDYDAKRNGFKQSGFACLFQAL